jgi:hypothetical protein
MWMQVLSIPTNSSLHNTPKYQFSLKSETIDNLTILLAGGFPSQEVHSGLGIFKMAAVHMETVNVCQNV